MLAPSLHRFPWARELPTATPARIRQPHQPFVDPDDHPPKLIVKPAFTALLDPMGSQRLSEDPWCMCDM